MEQPRRHERTRRNRMDGPSVQRTVRIPIALDRAMTALMTTSEFRNNRSAVLEQALIEFFNRRDDVRAA